jgi:hypothetical protein
MACDENEIGRLAHRLEGVSLGQLRARATQLVAVHRVDIALIAEELLRAGSLDEGEAQLVIDAAHGNQEAAYWLVAMRHPEMVKGGDA